MSSLRSQSRLHLFRPSPSDAEYNGGRGSYRVPAFTLGVWTVFRRPSVINAPPGRAVCRCMMQATVHIMAFFNLSHRKPSRGTIAATGWPFHRAATDSLVILLRLLCARSDKALSAAP